MRQITKRLIPGQDLREGIEGLVKDNQIKAGVVLSIVGGIKEGYFRMPDGKTVKHFDKPLEIVSGTGTISQDNCHIHISVSDEEGNVVGGHLKPGCVVKETAEIVLLVFDDVVYKREPDKSTGYDELIVQ